MHPFRSSKLLEIELRGQDLSKEERQKKLTEVPSGEVSLDDDDYQLLDELSACNHADVSVGAAALYAQMGDLTILPVLLLLSRESSASVREQACVGLSQFDNTRAIDRLVSVMLTDAEVSVRDIARQACKKAYADDLLQYIELGLLASHQEIRTDCVNMLAGIAKEQKEVPEKALDLIQQAIDSTQYTDVYKQGYAIYYGNQLAGKIIFNKKKLVLLGYTQHR